MIHVDISPNRFFVTAVLSVVIYFTLTLFFDPLTLRSLFNNFSLGMGVVVCFTWFTAMTEAARRHSPGWLLVVGIFLVFALLTYSRLYAMIAIELGRPPWLIDGPLSAVIPYYTMLIGVLFLTAPGTAPEAPKDGYWKHVLVGAILGALVTGFMIGRSTAY